MKSKTTCIHSSHSFNEANEKGLKKINLLIVSATLITCFASSTWAYALPLFASESTSSTARDSYGAGNGFGLKETSPSDIQYTYASLEMRAEKTYETPTEVVFAKAQVVQLFKRLAAVKTASSKSHSASIYHDDSVNSDQIKFINEKEVSEGIKKAAETFQKHFALNEAASSINSLSYHSMISVNAPSRILILKLIASINDANELQATSTEFKAPVDKEYRAFLDFNVRAEHSVVTVLKTELDPEAFKLSLSERDVPNSIEELREFELAQSKIRSQK